MVCLRRVRKTFHTKALFLLFGKNVNERFVPAVQKDLSLSQILSKKFDRHSGRNHGVLNFGKVQPCFDTETAFPCCNGRHIISGGDLRKSPSDILMIQNKHVICKLLIINPQFSKATLESVFASKALFA
jgi:hypothetical protein